MEPNSSVVNEKPLAGCDHEADISHRIFKAMRMAIAVNKLATVRADEHLLWHGLHGIAEGCAREVLQSLGYRLEHINIPNIHHPDYDGPYVCGGESRVFTAEVDQCGKIGIEGHHPEHGRVLMDACCNKGEWYGRKVKVTLERID